MGITVKGAVHISSASLMTKQMNIQQDPVTFIPLLKFSYNLQHESFGTFALSKGNGAVEQEQIVGL